MSNLKEKNKENLAKILLIVSILAAIVCSVIIFTDIYSGKSTFSEQITNIIALILIMVFGIYIYKSKDKKKSN